ncbi:hypothetical protein NFJ02_06g128120 [Pycnococcus provasolii]|uniref:Uncharacterized protein n=1 Tax=Pycnococcus provasolii TaxID=41880 RepID=A0A7S3DYU6_9CHLO|mmetsp:Transcript_2172/g.5357  ORF Transcript_2172/g.5357 Transcript_2172/m.5357 type:complete len:233 (+) Transcript_2172:3-701(+)
MLSVLSSRLVPSASPAASAALDPLLAVFAGAGAAPARIAARVEEEELIQEEEERERALIAEAEAAAAAAAAAEQPQQHGEQGAPTSTAEAIEGDEVDEDDDEKRTDDKEKSEGGIRRAKRARARDSTSQAKKLSRKKFKGDKTNTGFGSGNAQKAAGATASVPPSDALLNALAMGVGGVQRAGSRSSKAKRREKDVEPRKLAAWGSSHAGAPQAGGRSHAYPRSGNRTANFK